MNPAQSDGIALESHLQSRAPDAAEIFAPLLDELARNGLATGDVVARAFEAAHTRPAITTIDEPEWTRTGLPVAPPGMLASFQAYAERARIAWARGEIDRAFASARLLVEAVHANPGVLALEPALREPLRTALITVGLVRRSQRDFAGMRAAFGELARGFPGMLLGDEYGREANRAYEAVRNELAARTGTLTIRTSEYTKGVYIDGRRLSGSGAMHRTEVIAGEHLVMVHGEFWLSRSYPVIVRPGEHAIVSIDAVFDSAVHTGPGWTGLTFNTGETRQEMEDKFAADIARTIGAQDLVVVGFGYRMNRGRVAFAKRINVVNGDVVRIATVAVDEFERDPPVEQLRALARYVAGAPASDGVEDWPPSEQEPLSLHGKTDNAWAIPPSMRPRYAHRWWTGWPWVTGGAAVAALGTSVTLGILDDGFKNSPAAFWLVTGGAVLIGATLYLRSYNAIVQIHPRWSYLVPVPGGALAGVTAEF